MINPTVGGYDNKMIDGRYKDLGCAIVFQAIADCLDTRVPTAERNAALEFLATPYASIISDDTAIQAYKKIISSPNEVVNNLKEFEREDFWDESDGWQLVEDEGQPDWVDFYEGDIVIELSTKNIGVVKEVVEKHKKGHSRVLLQGGLECVIMNDDIALASKNWGIFENDEEEVHNELSY